MGRRMRISAMPTWDPVPFTSSFQNFCSRGGALKPAMATTNFLPESRYSILNSFSIKSRAFVPSATCTRAPNELEESATISISIATPCATAELFDDGSELLQTNNNSAKTGKLGMFFSLNSGRVSRQAIFSMPFMDSEVARLGVQNRKGLQRSCLQPFVAGPTGLEPAVS